METKTHAPSQLFSLLLAIYVGLSVAATAGANKIVALPGGYGASVTVFAFLGSLMVLNIINELFRRSAGDLCVHVSILANVIAVMVFAACAAAPAAEYWVDQGDFDRQTAYSFVLGPTFRFVVAGQFAAFVGRRLVNRLIERWRQSPFIIKHVFSTLLSELVDTGIFVPIAFLGTAPIVETFVGQYAVKAIFMIVFFHPILYLIMRFLKRSAGLAPYDIGQVQTVDSNEPCTPKYQETM